MTSHARSFVAFGHRTEVGRAGLEPATYGLKSPQALPTELSTQNSLQPSTSSRVAQELPSHTFFLPRRHTATTSGHAMCSGPRRLTKEPSLPDVSSPASSPLLPCGRPYVPRSKSDVAACDPYPRADRPYTVGIEGGLLYGSKIETNPHCTRDGRNRIVAAAYRERARPSQSLPKRKPPPIRRRSC